MKSCRHHHHQDKILVWVKSYFAMKSILIEAEGLKLVLLNHSEVFPSFWRFWGFSETLPSFLRGRLFCQNS